MPLNATTRTAAELDEIRAARKAGISSALKPSDLILPADEISRREAASAPW